VISGYLVHAKRKVYDLREDYSAIWEGKALLFPLSSSGNINSERFTLNKSLSIQEGSRFPRP
jgi:hypothetical protein